MQRENQGDNKGNDKQIKYIWLAVILAVVLLGAGFYLYYYYPEVIPSMAGIQQPETTSETDTTNEQNTSNEKEITNEKEVNNEPDTAKTVENEAKPEGEEKPPEVDQESSIVSGEETEEETDSDQLNAETEAEKTEPVKPLEPTQQSEPTEQLEPTEQTGQAEQTDQLDKLAQTDQTAQTELTQPEVKPEKQKEETKELTTETEQPEVKEPETNTEPETKSEIPETVSESEVKTESKTVFETKEKAEPVNVLLFGFDDLDIKNKQANVDLVVLGSLNLEGDRLKLINILTEDGFNLTNELKEEDIQKLRNQIETTIGMSVDYYLSISYDGFTHLVNNLGGITISRDEILRVPELSLYLKSGENSLNGKEALNYARWYDYRKDEANRIKRQQEVMDKLIEKALKNKTIMDLPQLFKTIVDTFRMVETNIPISLVTEITSVVKDRDNLKISFEVITLKDSENNINKMDGDQGKKVEI